MRVVFIFAPMLLTAIEPIAASKRGALDVEAAKRTTGVLLLFQ